MERGRGRREESVLCIYSVILCICILLMFLLWNHFYSNPRLRRPSLGSIAGRDGWIDDVWMKRGMEKKKQEQILSFKLYYSLKMMI